MLLSRPLNFPLTPKLSLSGRDFQTTLNHSRGTHVLDDSGGDVMERNEDASTKALALPAVALCFIKRRSHEACGQTGREDRQVVILY